GSGLGPSTSPATVTIHRPEALRRVLYAPSELGFGRAFVLGEIDIDGDAVAAFAALDAAAPDDLRIGARTLAQVVRGARRLGVLGRPLPPPVEEARLRGRLHTKDRDAAAIAHHYDVSNSFYELVLGPTMTYSCARFVTADTGLDEAQTAKYELIARKLGLRPGSRLLDVGCGWGGMVAHAAAEHGADAVGITLSRPQYEWARKMVADRGLADRVEIRIQDYRELTAGRFDAISSIGMFEHVGRVRLAEYFQRLAALLPPGGRLLNHGISTPEGAAFDRHSFVARYVFPDGELHDVATVVAGMEEAGLEVRDVETLREHYALTLRQWVANLERNWDEAVAIVGVVRARIWRLYMLGSIAGFESGDISVHQVLAVKPDHQGRSGMPLTRAPFG
ncbi:MAG: cyclopropane-fatty-acyl-phospholipid synthase, partial [Acidimicrobiaceae bacterium]|nr:cyclopropane-fatty-acyl-phospholipid synthase [Acidimicrobiaceae bacterium]